VSKHSKFRQCECHENSLALGLFMEAMQWPATRCNVSKRSSRRLTWAGSAIWPRFVGVVADAEAVCDDLCCRRLRTVLLTRSSTC
jgi:hypothetical protein